MNVTEAIAECRAGNKGAYREVVSAHADRLVGVLRKTLGNLEDARDIAQETFVRAYTNLHRYDPRRPFAPWLYRIGRNLAFNHIKAKSRRPEGKMEAAPGWHLEILESKTKSPDAAIVEEERRTGIEDVLERMRPEFREALTLRYMEKLEYEEIAARMSIPVGTVKTWLNRAKEQFRKVAEGSVIF